MNECLGLVLVQLTDNTATTIPVINDCLYFPMFCRECQAGFLLTVRTAIDESADDYQLSSASAGMELVSWAARSQDQEEITSDSLAILYH